MNKFRKILLLVVIIALAASFAGCMPVGTAQVTTELSTSSESPNPEMKGYTNDFTGMVQYLEDSELIAGEGTEMSADFIGAVAGQKFNFKYKEASMTCELYEFDTKNLTEKGKEVLESIKTNGTFKSLEKDIKAVISDNGKFVMIFVSSVNDENYLPFIDRINEKFKTFNGK